MSVTNVVQECQEALRKLSLEDLSSVDQKTLSELHLTLKHTTSLVKTQMIDTTALLVIEAKFLSEIIDSKNTTSEEQEICETIIRNAPLSVHHPYGHILRWPKPLRGDDNNVKWSRKQGRTQAIGRWRDPRCSNVISASTYAKKRFLDFTGTKTQLRLDVEELLKSRSKTVIRHQQNGYDVTWSDALVCAGYPGGPCVADEGPFNVYLVKNKAVFKHTEKWSWDHLISVSTIKELVDNDNDNNGCTAEFIVHLLCGFGFHKNKWPPNLYYRCPKCDSLTAEYLGNTTHISIKQEILSK
jgi:hypothetical protein